MFIFRHLKLENPALSEWKVGTNKYVGQTLHKAASRQLCLWFLSCFFYMKILILYQANTDTWQAFIAL